MEISKDIQYVGVNDHKIDLFEGQYKVPNGMSYNSYVILDDKIAIIDTVDAGFGEEWLKNINSVLNGKKPTYLIVEHMEPDHSSNIETLIKAFPEITIVSTLQASNMMQQFFGRAFPNKIIVKDGDTLSLGVHELVFITAPLVHWPEVTFIYDNYEKLLFSADAFGKFGALDVIEDWDKEAMRYYFAIVGKFGIQVQTVLKKLSAREILTICPLHGPVLKGSVPHCIERYASWSSYKSETDGVLIAFTSVYGNTKRAAILLEEKLLEQKMKAKTIDLARTDISEAVRLAFEFNKIVLLSTTYNNGVFPFMRIFIEELVERNFQNKKIAIIENGTWSPMAAKTIKTLLSTCKNLEFIEPEIKIMSTVSEQNQKEISALAANLTK